MKTLIFVFLVFLLGAAEYSIEIRQAPVADVIRLLTFIQKKNVLVPGDLSGTVTASFPEISIENALQTVLNSNQLVGILKADVLEVRTRKVHEELGDDLVTKTIPLKYARAKDILSQSSTLMAGGRGIMSIDERSNSVTIRANAAQMENIRKLLEGVDKPVKQVRIEARIVNATKSFSKEIGIQWGINGSVGPVTVGGLGGGGQINGRNLNVNTPPGGPLSGASLSMGPFGSTFIDAQLSAAEQNSKAKVLSRPSIVTLDHLSATMSSSIKYYIRTAGNLTISAGAGANAPGAAAGGAGQAGAGAAGSQMTGTLSEISAGIILVVTPHILPDNKIVMDVSVTSSTPGTLTEGIPSIDDNTAKTTVTVNDGNTTVIGGLVRMNTSNDKRGVPILSKIPILNLFFGNTKDTQDDRELMIFISPKIIEDADQATEGSL